MKPSERLSKGYAESILPSERKRQRQIAATYKPDALYDRFGQEPHSLERFGSNTRMAYGLYLQAKAAYEAEQKAIERDAVEAEKRRREEMFEDEPANG
jgi:hypothetical protein